MKVLFMFLFAVALTVPATTAFAQFSIGPRLGINQATWISDDEDLNNPGFRNGLLVGAVAEIRLNKVIAFQGELNFAQKGFQYKESSFGDLYQELLLMNYLEIPVLFKVGGGGKVRFDGIAGFSIGYALNGTYTEKYNGEKYSEDINFDDYGFNRGDFSLQLGGALSFKLGERTSLFADARYVQGLVDITTNEFLDSTELNTSLEFTAGALFHF